MATVTDLTGNQITTTDNSVSQDTDGTNLNRFNFGELILNDIILSTSWLLNYVSNSNGILMSISDNTGNTMVVADSSGTTISVIDSSGS